MPHCRSLKRRRSRLEVGFAGCFLLANPVQGAWPSFGAVWASLPHAHAPHGTQAPPPPSPAAAPVPASLRGSTSPSRRRRRGSIRHAPDSKPGRVLYHPPAGVHEVQIALHAGVGDWEACSPETCTQTRQVVCETRESKIVASYFCGDELPEAQRACVGEDIAAVCGDTAAAADAAAAAASREGEAATMPAAVSVESGGSTAGSRSESRPASVPSAANGSNKSGASKGTGAAGKADARTKSASSPSFTAASDNNNGNGSNRGQRGFKPAAASDKEQTETTPRNFPSAAPPPTKKATAPEAPAAPTSEGKDQAEAQDSGGNEEGGGGGGTDSTKSASSSRQQGGTPSNPSTSTANSSPKSTEPNLAASGGQLNQMGGAGPRSNRLEYRFWLVLAIGAGAVGSFMAAVVFAVGQYRKDQHRLRGIMALNEFPQDNYINPFAKQLSSDLSEDDRSAFKL